MKKWYIRTVKREHDAFFFIRIVILRLMLTLVNEIDETWNIFYDDYSIKMRGE